MTTQVRRAVALAGAGALAAGLTLALPITAAHAATDARPAALGATWLAAQPVDGLVTVKSEFNGQVSEFVDQGLSIDVALALKAAGGQDATVTEIRDAVAAEVAAGRYIQGDEYGFTEPFDFVQVGHYAGATAKTLTAATELGADPRDFGGVDLVAALEARVTASGRIADDSSYGDYANVVGQSFAVRGLGATDSTATAAVTDFLLLQQCDNGGFRLNFNSQDAGCTDPAEATTDATSGALKALDSLDSSDPDVVAAIEEGTDYLLDLQKTDGSFGGGATTEGANANSTGLAGSVLAELGEDEAATRAAIWVRAHQLTGIDACEPGTGAEAGAIAYNDDDLTAAAQDGIGDLERGIYVRSAAQALPLLTLAPAAEGTLGVQGKNGYLAGGSRTAVTLTGVAAGERVCVVGGKAAVTATGPGTATVTLPASTGVRTLTLVTADDSAETTVSVLGKAKLKVKAAKAAVKKGKKNKVTVTGLAAGEKVKLKLGKKAVAKGTANAKGTFKAKVKAPKKAGKVKLQATGQFANRKGATTFRVR
ncbi:prenyltransferase/squalene oxidase repeat-containing protein [Nocardioides daejeonensis]|uniref:prenyltransferase/squalene oxidase repeat-containing protein n=1 Tax=Nocardioides daejeonensis TaxID=1046556 RepID=UPI000D746A2A|nr:prenyltransferase/squalene oxidase repeat-containing protein [Nocardioides daejeonensis]